MASDPAVNGKQVMRVLEKFGFRLDRVDGSHHMMKKPGHWTIVPVPVHGSSAVAKGTLGKIIRLASLTKDEFFDAVK